MENGVGFAKLTVFHAYALKLASNTSGPNVRARGLGAMTQAEFAALMAMECDPADRLSNRKVPPVGMVAEAPPSSVATIESDGVCPKKPPRITYGGDDS